LAAGSRPFGVHEHQIDDPFAGTGQQRRAADVFDDHIGQSGMDQLGDPLGHLSRSRLVVLTNGGSLLVRAAGVVHDSPTFEEFDSIDEGITKLEAVEPGDGYSCRHFDAQAGQFGVPSGEIADLGSDVPLVACRSTPSSTPMWTCRSPT
jgi:hypothetical protein